MPVDYMCISSVAPQATVYLEFVGGKVINIKSSWSHYVNKSSISLIIMYLKLSFFGQHLYLGKQIDEEKRDIYQCSVTDQQVY